MAWFLNQNIQTVVDNHTFLLQDLYLEILPISMHSNKLRLFWAKAFPPSYWSVFWHNSSKRTHFKNLMLWLGKCRELIQKQPTMRVFATLLKYKIKFFFWVITEQFLHLGLRQAPQPGPQILIFLFRPGLTRIIWIDNSLKTIFTSQDTL